MENRGNSSEASASEARPPVQPLEGGHVVSPTSKMPELSTLTDYLKDLTEQEWVDFCRLTDDPVTKRQFFNLCMNLVHHVTMSSMTAVVPALLKLLRDDPQQFRPSPDPCCPLDTTAAGPSVRGLEGGQHVAVLELMKAAPSTRKGHIQDVRTLDSHCSTEERSQQMSLLDQFGITEKGIQQSVQMTLKELKVVECPAATEELTSSIVKEAIVWVNTHLAEFKKISFCEPESKAPKEAFNTEELVEKISMKLNSQKSPENTRQPLLCWKRCISVCPSEEDSDSTLSSAVGSSMSIIIDTIESSLGEEDEEVCMNKPAKRLLSTIRQAVNTFACQSLSLSEVSFYDEDFQGDHKECVSVTQSNQSQVFEPMTRALSFDDFRLRATEAVSSVLIIKMRDFGSVPSSYAHICATDISPSLVVLKDETEPYLDLYRKPVEEAASMVVETFVEEMKAIVQSAECVNEMEVAPIETLPDDVPSMEKSAPDAKKNPALLAAKKIFGKVQKTLEDFYIQLPSKLYQAISAPSSDKAPQATTQEQEDAPIQDFILPPQVRTVSHGHLQQIEREATHPIQIFLSQPQLDSCTRNVLKGVLTSYQEQKEVPKPEEMSFDPSTTSSNYVWNVISQLSDMTSSPVESLSLSTACVENLSSATFQRNAFDAVVDVLVTSVKSNMSFVSSDSTDVRAVPKNNICSPIPLEEEVREANAAASEIVDHFERDLQKCIESLRSLSISDKTGFPEGEGNISEMGLLRSVTRTKKIPEKEFLSAASKLYQSIQTKVREIFTQLAFQRKHRYMRLEEMPSKDNISDLSLDSPALSDPLNTNGEIPVSADLEDCTREVMGELLMAFKEHVGEDQTSCPEGKISATGSHLAGNIMLEIENNFVCPSSTSMQSSADKKGSAESAFPTTEVTQNLSSEDIQTKAVKEVSQVLLKSARSNGTLSSLPAESTALDLVGTFVEGIQTLLQSTSNVATVKTISDGKGERDEGVLLDSSEPQTEATKHKIWSATKEIFGSLQSKVKDFFTKSQLQESEVDEQLFTREAISNVLFCIQEEVPNSGLWERDSECLHLFHETVNSMLQTLSDIDVLRPTSASTSDMCSESSEDESLAGITRGTMTDVVKAIIEKVDPGDASLSHAQGLSSIARRLEMSLSRSSVNSSHDLIDQVYSLFVRSNSTTLRHCASDTAVVNQQQREESRIPTASEILQLYIEESVKHLFLPCFKLPSPWSAAKGGLPHQTKTSISCPSSLTDLSIDAQGKMSATKTPSQILSDTVTLVIDMMVKEVMTGLTRSLTPSDNLENIEETSHGFSMGPTKSISSRLTDRQMSAETTADFKITTWPDDYSSLVTLLVIQLLTNINNESICDDMVCKARVIIAKVVTAFCACSGISANESYPKNIRLHKIYASVLDDLLNEFGSKMILLKAMKSNDPSFERSMVRSLTREILQIIYTKPVDGSAEPSVPPLANMSTAGSEVIKSESREDRSPKKSHFIKIFSVLRRQLS